MAFSKSCIVRASMIGLMLSAELSSTQVGMQNKVAQRKCEGTDAAGTNAPTPADPYPLNAAGWGPEVGNGLLVSRWAEDWTALRAAGNAPPLKSRRCRLVTRHP